MNYRFVIFSIGKLLQVFGLILLLPAAMAWYEATGSILQRLHTPSLFGFSIAILFSFLFGSLIVAVYKKNNGRIDVREGFAIVTFGWILLTLVGSIPLWTYLLSKLDTFTISTVTNSFTDAFFEIMSGLTTTGATIFTDVEALPSSLLFWRSLTHWIGGMGIVTLGIALLPAFEVSAYQLFRGEVPALPRSVSSPV